MLNILSNQGNGPTPALCYLFPFQWWINLQDLNSEITTLEQLVVPPFDNQNHFSDKVTEKQRSSLVQSIAEKCAFLQIDELITSPKPKTNSIWKPISKTFYQFLIKKSPVHLELPVYLIEEEEQNLLEVSPTIQFRLIKILFCSGSSNKAFYGYVCQNSASTNFIQQLPKLLDYESSLKTKITFLEVNPLRNFKFIEVTSQQLKKQGLLLIHGLGDYDNNIESMTTVRMESTSHISSNYFESPQVARVGREGEEITMADEDSLTLSEHTLSTGAQTPFSFFPEQHQGNFFLDYQNHGLFGNGLSQEIHNMKQYAKEAIYTDTIQIPLQDQKDLLTMLNKVSEDVYQNIDRKKTNLKEPIKGQKEVLKENLFCCCHREHQNLRDCGFNCSRNRLKEWKQVNLTQDKQLQQKTHRAKVYYLSGDDQEKQ